MPRPILRRTLLLPRGLPPRDPRPRWDIQGLRAFAVVAVVVNHVTGWPRGGFVGVDVFFVISGFLITGLLLREYETTGHISFRGFYRRRIKRIMPALVLVLVATVLGARFAFNTVRWHDTVVDAGWSLLFAANWRFASQSTDYFAQDRAVSPLQHYWSLAVEEQFYLVWPWLLLFVAVVVVRRSRHTRKAVGATIALLSVASFLWALVQTQTAPGVAYFSTFTRAWELGLGALVAVAAPLCARVPASWRTGLAWLGLAGMVAGLFVVRPGTGLLATEVALPVASAALVIVAGTGGSQQRVLPLTNRVSGYVGDISYSLYLWHFPVIVLGRTLLGDSPAVRWALVGATVVLAAYSYHLVEDPIRRSGWLTGSRADRAPRRHRSGRASAWRPAERWAGLSLLGLVVAAMVAGAALRESTALQAAAPAPAVAVTLAPADRANPELAELQNQLAQSLAQTRWPRLRPTMEQAIGQTTAYDDVRRCGSRDRDDAACVWGDPAATRTMVTVGNSLSVVYSRTLRTVVGDRSGWRVVPYGMYACPFGDPAVQPITTDRSTGCADRVEQAVAAINRLKPDVVVLSGVRSVAAVVSQLDKVTVPVRYVVIPGPPEDKDVEDCYTPTSTPGDCVSTVPTGWGQRDQALAAEVRGTFVDSRRWFCVGNRCPSFAGTTPTKIDKYHISAEYSDRIAPVVRAELTQRGVLRVKEGKEAKEVKAAGS